MDRLTRQRNLSAEIADGFAVATGEFDESKHPRDDHGRFGAGSGPSVPPDLQARRSVQIGDGATTGSVRSPGIYGMSKKGLAINLERGSFSTLTAANPMGQPQPEAVNHRLNEELKRDLLKAGAVMHEVDGIYTNDHGVTSTEPSFMVHHMGRITPAFIERLGHKYNQESVLHYTLGDTTIRYTSGDKMGQDKLKLDRKSVV